MSASSRRKGVQGEREVAAAFQAAGFEVRGLESGGDHLCIRADGLTLLAESKRGERVKMPEWVRQVERDTPSGVVGVLCWRQNHGAWRADVALTDLLALLAAKT